MRRNIKLMCWINLFSELKLYGAIIILYYIQVSLSIENQETRKREVFAFKGLDDGYKKIVITMDNNPLIRLDDGYKMTGTKRLAD